MDKSNLTSFSRQDQIHGAHDLGNLPIARGDDCLLPCLNSNNCTDSDLENPFSVLSPYHRKQSLVQIENADRFISNHGIDRVGFLTLTFADNVTDNKEASRRFKSLRTHAFGVFGHWMLVKERQVKRGVKNGGIGAWHYHILVDSKVDIRSGFDWKLYTDSIDLRIKGLSYRHIERQAFKTANQNLKNIWSYLRLNLQNYGFGRHEFLPIRTNAEATAKYIGKYISKHMTTREKEDLGVRLFACSQGQVMSSTKFSWNTEGGKEWRKKLSYLCHDKLGSDSTDILKQMFGRHWAYHLAGYIYNYDILGD